MDPNDDLNSPSHRAPPAPIGADPGDRYTRLLHRTRSRDEHRARLFGAIQSESSSRRGTESDTTIVEESSQPKSPAPLQSGRNDPNNASVPQVPTLGPHTLVPSTQRAHFGIVPFEPASRPSTIRGIPEPPPTYDRYLSRRVPATEPIHQMPQFDDPLRVYPQEQGTNPFCDPNNRLRQRNPAHPAYYVSPIVPPQPTMGANLGLGFSDMYTYPPGRTNAIQPVHQEYWDDDDYEEKHVLADYHAKADWDPDDEYYDTEPSVAARHPYADTALPGYRPPGNVNHTPNRHWDAQNQTSVPREHGLRPQTTIIVGSEKGMRHFITENICPIEQRRSFVLTLAKALLQFQAPSHRIENQLEAAARVLEVPAEFLHIPSLVIVSFGSLNGEKGAPTGSKPRKFGSVSQNLKAAITTAILGKNKKDDGYTPDGPSDLSDSKNDKIELDTAGPEFSMRGVTFGIQVHIVKSGGRLELGKLHELHQIYRRVVHDELSAQDGRIKLLKLLKQPPIYSLYERCSHAFICGLLICVMSFGGSFMDMWIAGAGCAMIAYLQLNTASKNPMYSNIFEISAAMMMSFVARGLSSIRGNLFCYSAISSAGVVLILPGSIVLSSSLELASRNVISGSVKMVYAIVYSLFLGFSLTIGSDLYYLVDRSARPRMIAALSNVTDSYDLPGVFTDDYGQIIFNGAFTFLKPAASVSNTVKYVAKGCARQVDGPWYLGQLPIWTLFILVPVYSTISSLWKLQPFRSMQLPIMVFISCCSYAANKAANRYIFNRSDVVSAIGAFVTGILGNAYARIFRGTAFTAMVTAVSFLVPSGIAAAGGLAQTYENSEGDQYSTGLALGFRMVQVAIGCTVGLFGAGVVVYSFGGKKRSGYFAF